MSITATVAGVMALGLASGPARADTAPPVASTPLTVSSDPLPTAQINGVAWAQVIVGNTVYVTGSFTRARPAGAAAGVSETTRSHILAYDLTTGVLKSSWAPSLNAQGLAIAASADGRRIIVAGDFTKVNGVTRYRIAELDATTGALVTSFAPSLNARARALAVKGNTVYVGGIFTTASSKARTRLAAFSVTNGALQAWAPTADQEVMALTAPPGTTKVVVGGRFTRLNSTADYGLGAVDATTGATVAWAASATIKNSGSATAINSLTSDATQVYGTGYTFGGGGNLEGSFAAASSTGAIAWINGCKGDSYSVAVTGKTVYSVSHAHDCATIGAFPQTVPWNFAQRAMSLTTYPNPNGRKNDSSSKFPGWVAPQMLHWLPTLTTGTYTGQGQAAWSVAANSNYVVLGGEFLKVDGVARQGLVRFAVKAIAPNKDPIQGYSDMGFSVTSPARGQARATFKAAWDRDNTHLTFQLLRGAKLSTAVVVATTTANTNWWTRPALTLTDPGAPSGTKASYRVKITDPFGNTMFSPTLAITVW